MIQKYILLSFFSSLLCKNETLVKYTVVTSIPLIIIAILYANSNIWRASEIHHFYFEMFAVAISTMMVYDKASIVAFYCITCASFKNSLSIFYYTLYKTLFCSSNINKMMFQFSSRSCSILDLMFQNVSIFHCLELPFVERSEKNYANEVIYQFIVP